MSVARTGIVIVAMLFSATAWPAPFSSEGAIASGARVAERVGPLPAGTYLATLSQQGIDLTLGIRPGTDEGFIVQSWTERIGNEYALLEAADSEVIDIVVAAPDQAGDVRGRYRLHIAPLDDTRFDDVLARLAEAGIAPQFVATWHDALAPLPGFVQLLVVDERVLICDEDGTLASFSGLSPEAVLDAWRATCDDDDAARNLRVYADERAQERFGDDIDRLVEAGADLKLLPDGLLPFAARHIVGRGGINLLQGRYAVRSNVGTRLRPWAWAAGLAAATLGLSLIASAVELRRLNAESARLDADIVSVLERVRPGSGNVSNPEAQLRAILDRAAPAAAETGGAAASGAPFLGTLVSLAGAMRAAGDDTRIDAISYRAGVFDIRLTTPSAQTLEGLTQRVAKSSGLVAQIQRTEQEADAIKSFVQIRGGER